MNNDVKYYLNELNLINTKGKFQPILHIRNQNNETTRNMNHINLNVDSAQALVVWLHKEYGVKI
jgi:hypothetical protein